MDHNEEVLEPMNEREELPRDSLEDTLDSLEDTNNLEDEELGQQSASGRSIKLAGPIKDAAATAAKGFLAFIKKNPWVVGLFLIAFILLIAILIFAMDFDLFGVGNPKPKYYETPACGKVILTWENESYTTARKKKEPGYTPLTDGSLITDLDEEDEEYGIRYSYEEYDYDTYITSIVWFDNNEAKDIDNEVVYEAMAIAARSRLIATLPDNCVVLKNYDAQAQSFVKLDGSEEKYTEIAEAVKLSQGIIIGRNGQIIPALYDPFSYTKKRKDNEENKDRYFYHMMNENEEKYHVIPADWVDELEKEKGVEIPKKTVPTTKYLESLSLYGAKYLLELEDSQYELYRILETYYGRDIEYYTIDYAFSDEYTYNPDCSDISMKSTSLSRDAFIALVKSYGNKGGGAKILADNAGMIYDMATSNGINPELVFIRADVEGYSPGSSHNNYWGIGCTNTGGLAACKSYGSLSEGVSAFLKYISQFSTLTELTGKYAYLGSYWYNPGGSGVGGCYYAPYIYTTVPERVKDACSSKHPCTTAHEPTCVATTEEDKQAYLVYQSQIMVKARKRIFNLDADTCEAESGMGEPGTGSCTIWKQGDSRWGSIKLGTSSLTMANSGCAVTSVAIAMSCSGITINNVASFNPGTLVKRLNSSGGFKGASINWSSNAINYFAPSFHFVESKNGISGSASARVAEVTKRIGENTSILLHFTNEKHPRGHYVVFKAVSGTNFTVYDPATGSINTYSASDLDSLRVYKY